MKYKDEYVATETRAEFMELVLKNYKDIKEGTAKRRWYDIRSKLGDQQKVPQHIKSDFKPNEIKEPERLKLLAFLDMKRYGMKVTKTKLEKEGYTSFEINWMVDRELVSEK